MIKQKTLFLLLILNLIVLSLIVFDYTKAKNVDAQTCVSIATPRFEVGRWRDPGGGTNFGRWTYCAISKAEGMDDNGGEGIEVWPDNRNTFYTSGSPLIIDNNNANKPQWYMWVGNDIEHWEVICFRSTS
jgi:hypothetical protein